MNRPTVLAGRTIDLEFSLPVALWRVLRTPYGVPKHHAPNHMYGVPPAAMSQIDAISPLSPEDYPWSTDRR